jgi:RNA polymerase sigma factor (sigma-70 family)
MELHGSGRAILDMTPTDADAIRRSLHEPAAFGAVFDRHFAAVHAFAQRRVGAELAEEVAAEAFARAFAHRKRYGSEHQDALPWLLGIATNLMRRHWRTERRRLDAYARVASQHVDHVDPHTAESAIKAVARLPRGQREVVLLHVWADLSYEQIARALDIPLGTVRSRLNRARGALGADTTLLEPSRA